MATVGLGTAGQAQRSGGLKKPWEVFDQEILPYLTLEGVFGDLRTLRRDGRFWQACCPLHPGDRDGAFSIDPERLEWNCFLGCGGGGPVQYLQQRRSLAWPEAARELARMAGLDPAVLDAWTELWTEDDYRRHQELEFRSSLLGVFIAYARSNFWSSAGRTIRQDLCRRRGFPETRLPEIPLGLYSAPEDVWHYLKGTRRDLEEVRGWGLFEPKWSGQIVGPWKDMQGRIINVWGWKPMNLEAAARGAGCLFQENDPVGGKSVPFNLEAAARRGERDLLLVESPHQALLLLALDQQSPFPIAAAGHLNAGQVETLQRYLSGSGSLTLCWDYDPETQGTVRDRTARTVEYLKQSSFPLFVIDPRLLMQGQPSGQRGGLDDFMLRHGNPDRARAAFSELLEKRETETIIHPSEIGREPHWPGVMGLLRGFASGDSPAWEPKRERSAASAAAGADVLEPLFRAAEEIGRRLAGGFLRAMPRGLLKSWEEAPEQKGPPVPALAGELAADSRPLMDSVPGFSVERLEAESRDAPLRRTTGWASLEARGIRFNPGELTVVGGRTAHGKTAFLLNLLVEWLKQTEETGRDLFLFYSVQETEIRIYHRLLSLLTAEEGRGWTIHQIEDQLKQDLQQGELPRGRVESLNAARRQIRSWEKRLQTLYQPDWTLEELRAYVVDLAADRQIGAILVDHLRIPATRGRPSAGQRAPGAAARRLKALAVAFSCPVLSTVQLPVSGWRRPEEGPLHALPGDRRREILRERRPRLHALRRSGIEPEADLVLGIFNHGAEYRAEGEETDPSGSVCLEVGSLKNRYGPVGIWSELDLEERFGRLREPVRREAQRSGPDRMTPAQRPA